MPSQSGPAFNGSNPALSRQSADPAQADPTPADDPSRLRDRQCIGYAEFCSRLETDSTFARWFNDLAADISELANRKIVRIDRLVALEKAVADLIDFLDPDNVRYPLRSPRRVLEITSDEPAAWGTQSWGKDMV